MQTWPSARPRTPKKSLAKKKRRTEEEEEEEEEDEEDSEEEVAEEEAEEDKQELSEEEDEEAEVGKFLRHHWVGTVDGMELKYDLQWASGFGKAYGISADGLDTDGEKFKLYNVMHGLHDDGYVGEFIDITYLGKEYDRAFVTKRTDTAIFGDDAEYWDVMFFEDGSTERVPLTNMAMTGYDGDAWEFNRDHE